MAMATKRGRRVTYHEGLPPIKSLEPLITWFGRSRDKIKTSPLPLCLWPPNLVAGDLPRRTPSHIVTWCFDQVISWDHVSNQNHYVSATAVLIAIKLGKTVSYFEQLSPIKLLDPLITCSCKLMWQTIIIIMSPLSLFITTKLGRFVTWGAPIHIVKWLLNHVTLQDHMTN